MIQIAHMTSDLTRDECTKTFNMNTSIPVAFELQIFKSDWHFLVKNIFSRKNNYKLIEEILDQSEQA